MTLRERIAEQRAAEERRALDNAARAYIGGQPYRIASRPTVSPFVRRAQSGTLPASDRTAGR